MTADQSPAATAVLDQIVKAYDVRGTVPDQLNEHIAYALGVGFARFAGAQRVLVGRDMRPSGIGLVDAFASGVTGQGVDVIDIGLASTDMLYFAAGSLDVPGAMFTASHNPAQYNGVKFCLSGARPVGQDSGLDEISAIAAAVLSGSAPASGAAPGMVSQRNLLETFVDHVLSFMDVENMRPLRVVADTANGMGGLVVPAVFGVSPRSDLKMAFSTAPTMDLSHGVITSVRASSTVTLATWLMGISDP